MYIYISSRKRKGKWSFAHLESLQMFWNKGLQNKSFTGKFPNIVTKTIFLKC